MAGSIVSCTNLDSVRIEVLGEGRAVTVPASLVLAADRVLRETLLRDIELVFERAEGGTGARMWRAALGGIRGWSVTPWGAIEDLARKLEVTK
jgi:hypothetical protein